MSPEIPQEYEWLPRVYYNDRLGIPLSEWSTNTVFFEDGEEKRVQEDWKGCFTDGRLGWQFGHSTPAWEGGSEYELVKWDDAEIDGIHKSHLRYL